MSRLLKQNLLRSFFSHSAEAGLKLNQGKIEGVIFRHQLVRSLSDIAMADDSPIPVESVATIDELLNIHTEYGIEKDSKVVLPVFDTLFELQQFWGRAEIIQAFEAIPVVSTWQPPKLSRDEVPAPEEPRPSRAHLYDLFVPPLDTPQEQLSDKKDVNVEAASKKSFEIKVNIRKPEPPSTTPVQGVVEGGVQLKQAEDPSYRKESTEPKNEIDPVQTQIQETRAFDEPQTQEPVRSIKESSKTPSRVLASRMRVELEQGKLAILTIEALGLPLLAIDTQGNELFHNHEWEGLQARYPGRFEPAEIIIRARDVMARSALAGQLDVDATLELEGLLRGKTFFLKTIRDQVKVGHAIGYLIWSQQGTGTRVPSNPEPLTHEAGSYMGRTLTEILAEEERKILFWAYEEADGNQTNAAMLLGIPRQTYSYRLKKFLKSDKKQENKVIKRQSYGATVGHEGDPLKNQDTE